MSAWDMYQQRMDVHGGSKRNTSLVREKRFLETKLPDSLSYQSVDIIPQEYSYNVDSQFAHRFTQNVAIINTDNLNEKTIISMPSEDVELGSLVYWMDNYWIVCERDANTTVYTKAKLLQCNHLLKWIASDKQIMSQWCVIEDGTKYMSGEMEDRNFVTTRGDSRIQLQISKNIYTSAFNRESRFLIDDEDSPHKLSYLLTKPLKRGFTYNSKGIFKFILQEVTATEDDNHELGIANYYKYFPKNESTGGEVQDAPTQSNLGKRQVWI